MTGTIVKKHVFIILEKLNVSYFLCSLYNIFWLAKTLLYKGEQRAGNPISNPGLDLFDPLLRRGDLGLTIFRSVAL